MEQPIAQGPQRPVEEQKRDEWDVKELRETVDRLQKENLAYQRRIKYLEDTKTELVKARDEALLLIQKEREEKSRLAGRLETPLKRPDGKLSLRRAPAARLRRLD